MLRTYYVEIMSILNNYAEPLIACFGCRKHSYCGSNYKFINFFFYTYLIEQCSYKSIAKLKLIFTHLQDEQLQQQELLLFFTKTLNSCRNMLKSSLKVIHNLYLNTS